MPLDNPFEPMIKNIGNYVSGTLYAQGVIPPIGITNYDGTAVASQADTHLLAAKDAVINEIAVGMSGNLIGENTVTGAPPLQLPNSAGYPLQGLEVALSPYQDLHGYDAPWPAGGGKNLIKTTSGTVTRNGITATVNEDGSVRLSGTATVGTTIDLWGNPSEHLVDLEAGAAYTASDVNIQLNGTTAKGAMISPNTFTASAGDYISFVWLYISSGESVDKTFYPQLEKGSSKTTFAPYSNLCPILGTDKLNIFAEESYDPAATPKAVITLPQTVYTGTIGSEGGESRSAELIADDSLNWSVSASNSTNIVFSVNVLPYGTAVEIGQISNMFVRNSNANAPSDSSRQNTFVLGVSGNLFVQVSIAEYPDVDTFKALLTVTPLHLVYPLDTPTTFAVPSTIIPTPTGTATTWATAEDGTVDSMGVTYIRKA